MVAVMRTTLNLKDDLLTEAKAQAAKNRTTLTALVEQGLKLVLSQNIQAATQAPVLPVFGGEQGLVKKIDLSSNKAMYDACDADS